MTAYCSALALILLAVRVSAAEDAAAPAIGDPLADLVIQGFDRPLRLRVHATHDGLAWNQFASAARSAQLQSLFQQLDADADGRLAPDEARRLPRPEALGRTQPSSDVNVAFNFRVLDADADGFGTPAELQAYVAEFTRPGPALGFVTAQIDRFPGDLFPALDLDRDRRLAVDEWSAFLQLLDRDRDGNRVLTPDELRSPSAELFGPEFLALPIAQRSAGAPPPLVAALEPPGADDPDGVVSLRLIEADRAAAPLAIELHLNETARALGIQVDSRSPQGVRLRIGRRFLEFACVPSGNRANSALSAALLRQYDALVERLGRSVTTSDELPAELKSAFSVADADGNGSLERSELERCISGFIAARASSVASRLSVMFVPERRGLSPLIDANRDGRISLRELHQLPMRLAPLIDDSGTIQFSETPAVAAVVFCQGASVDALDPVALANAGPPWFVRADRNSDGDLDADEFMGPPDVFARLDVNGDGWIELAESLQINAADLVPGREPGQ